MTTPEYGGGTGGPANTGAFTPDFSAPVPPGVLPAVPGVRLDQQIGRGGYATVYRGRQLSVDRDVAVKVDDRRLLADRDKRRFTREIVAAGSVSAHPHIVTVYDGGTTADGHPYLVMELYPGGSYSDRIKASGPVPPAEVLDVGVGIADALAVAHGEGILHRDVKPGNILISRYGSPALADFGLAALPRAAEGFSVTMESLTPSYAPPEAFGGSEPTRAMDIYSLGATLYALLQGRAPRSDKSGTAPPLARLLYMLNEPLPIPETPGAAALMPVIWRATAFEPARRYTSVAMMRDDLIAVRAGRLALPSDRFFAPDRTSTGSVVPGSAAVADPSPPRRRRPWIWIAAASVVAAVLVAGLILFGGRPSTSGVAQAGSTVVAEASTSRPPLETDLSRLMANTGSPKLQTATVITTPAVRTAPVTPPPSTTPPSTPPPSTAPPSTAPPTDRESPAPPVGTCWGGLLDTGVERTAVQIPCDQPHYWEAYATGVLSAASTSPYVDQLEKDPAIAKTCTKSALSKYVGKRKHQTYNVEMLPPRPLDFASGARGFWCLAAVAGAGEVTSALNEK